jgi:hypothetical protein
MLKATGSNKQVSDSYIESEDTLEDASDPAAVTMQNCLQVESD